MDARRRYVRGISFVAVGVVWTTIILILYLKGAYFIYAEWMEKLAWKGFWGNLLIRLPLSIIEYVIAFGGLANMIAGFRELYIARTVNKVTDIKAEKSDAETLLKQFNKSSNAIVRKEVLIKIAAMGHESAEVLPQLKALLDSNLEPAFKIWVHYCLYVITDRNNNNINSIINILEKKYNCGESNPDLGVVSAATAVLEKIGEKGIRALLPLATNGSVKPQVRTVSINMLRDEFAKYRDISVIKSPDIRCEIIDAFINALKDVRGWHMVRNNAHSALQMIFKKDWGADYDVWSNWWSENKGEFEKEWRND